MSSELKYNYFGYPLFLLRITGHWAVYEYEISDVARLCYNAYTLMLAVAVQTMYPVFEILDIYYNINDLNHVTQNLIYSMQHYSGLPKILISHIRTDDIRWLVKVTEDEPFQRPFDDQYQSKAKAAKKIADFLTNYFVIVVFFAVISGIVSATLDVQDVVVDDKGPGFTVDMENSTIMSNASSSIVMHKRVLPIKLHFPFVKDISASPYYEIALFYEIYGILIYAISIMSLDMLLMSMMVHLILQFKYLQKDLRSVRTDAEQTVMENVAKDDAIEQETLNREIVKEMVRRFKIIIKHHQKILEFSSKLESVFTGMLLAQFLCSLISVGIVLLLVSMIEAWTFNWINNSIYFSAVMFQLFINCYFGNEIMVQSTGVRDAAYDCCWEQCGYTGGIKELSPYILTIMMRAEKPTFLTAGKFSIIELDSFVTIVKASYSYYTVLAKTA